MVIKVIMVIVVILVINHGNCILPFRYKYLLHKVCSKVLPIVD
jgi:hypothetical protein